MTHVLGIDVGGTKLRAQLFDTSTVLDLTLPSTTWLAFDSEAVTRELSGLRDRLPVVPSAVCVGASGCETDLDAARIRAGLRPLWPDAAIEVVNDAELVLPAAGLAVGTALISGTGAIGIAVRQDGSTRRAGGWGALLGDEGSAFHLVRMAARHVLDRHERDQPPDALTTTMQTDLRASTVLDLLHSLQALGAPSELAALAPSVCGLAEEGDPVATRLVHDVCAALVAITGRVNDGLDEEPIVCAGGLVTHNPQVARELTRQLGDVFPRSSVSVLDAPPVSGAVRRARQLVATTLQVT